MFEVLSCDSLRELAGDALFARHVNLSVVVWECGFYLLRLFLYNIGFMRLLQSAIDGPPPNEVVIHRLVELLLNHQRQISGVMSDIR